MLSRNIVALTLFHCFGLQVISDIVLSRLGLDPDETLPYSRAGLRPLMEDWSQPDQQEDTIFVTQDGFINHGIFFAFTAFWIGSQPFQVQIWRPSQSGDDLNPLQTLNFVGDVEINPEQINITHTVYIVSSLDQKCIRVKKGDRIGFQVKVGSTSPFSIIYDESLEKSFVLIAIGNNGNMSHLNHVTFVKTMFPYRMNFIAYLLVDNAQSNDPLVECPRNLVVESITTTTPALVLGDIGPMGDEGPMGDTGAVGPVGGTGLTGLAGPTGPTGLAGVKGATGGTGYTGPVGMPGDQGIIGDSGTMGYPGNTGQWGDTGPSGGHGSPGYLVFVNETDNSSGYFPLADHLSIPLNSDVDWMWKSESYMIGLLIWFSLLSLLTLIFVVVLCSKLHGKVQRSSMTSTIMSHDVWNTLATSAGSDLEFMNSGKGSTLNSEESPVIVKSDGMDTLRAYSTDENLRALREDTFKELTNETITMY